MEPNNDLKEPETIIEVVDADTTASVDDFIKELEAKEKDLHIDADYEIEIELLDRPDLAPAGAGETPIIAIAPAVGNAVFNAIGRRIKDLPITRDKILGALA